MTWLHHLLPRQNSNISLPIASPTLSGSESFLLASDGSPSHSTRFSRTNYSMFSIGTGADFRHAFASRVYKTQSPSHGPLGSEARAQQVPTSSPNRHRTMDRLSLRAWRYNWVLLGLVWCLALLQFARCRPYARNADLLQQFLLSDHSSRVAGERLD